MSRGKAEVTHPVLSKPPLISRSDITPDVMREWEDDVHVFFLNAKGGIKDDEKVPKIMTGFRDPIVRSWLNADEDRLSKLPYEDFVQALRAEFLEADWEADTRADIVGSRLDPTKERFHVWARRIRELNVNLIGTPSHFSDTQMRSQLEACIDRELRRLAKDDQANKLTSLSSWIARMRDLDLKRTNDRKCRLEELEQHLGNKRPAQSYRARPPTEQPSSSKTGENPYPPPLNP